MLALSGHRTPQPHFARIIADAPQCPDVDLDSLRNYPFGQRHSANAIDTDTRRLEFPRLSVLNVRIGVPGR